MVSIVASPQGCFLNVGNPFCGNSVGPSFVLLIIFIGNVKATLASIVCTVLSH